MGYKRVTKEEREDLYRCFDAGMTEREIHERTGRSNETIYRIKREWKLARQNVVPVVQVVTPIEESAPSMAESDYAKAYLSGDPRWANSSLSIKKSIQIESSATGFKYEMGAGADSIQITTPDGSWIEVPMKDFEKFSNEIVDVFIECSDFKKKR